MADGVASDVHTTQSCLVPNNVCTYVAGWLIVNTNYGAVRTLASKGISHVFGGSPHDTVNHMTLC